MSEKSAYDWDTLGSFSDELIKIPDTADCTGTIRPGHASVQIKVLTIRIWV